MERRGAMEVEAELKAPGARIQLVRYHFNEPPDSKPRADGQFRAELCLTSRHRSARACFCDHWSTHRFERIGALFNIQRKVQGGENPTSHRVARCVASTTRGMTIHEFE